MHLRIGRQRITSVFASWRSFDCDYNRLRRAISKGDAQRESKDNREPIGPEKSRRLADKDAPAHQRELPQRMLEVSLA
jgi:hypothetical protein